MKMILICLTMFASVAFADQSNVCQVQNPNMGMDYMTSPFAYCMENFMTVPGTACYCIFQQADGAQGAINGSILSLVDYNLRLQADQALQSVPKLQMPRGF